MNEQVHDHGDFFDTESFPPQATVSNTDAGENCTHEAPFGRDLLRVSVLRRMDWC
jgi:hypothetical protein